MRRSAAIPWILLIVSLVPSPASLPTAQPDARAAKEPAALAVRVASLTPRYRGPQQLVVELEYGRAVPTTLAVADFDEDGIPDLLCGYGAGDSGALVLHRGVIGAVYPHDPRASGQPSPFLETADVMAVPTRPDFVEVGDCQHWAV